MVIRDKYNHGFSPDGQMDLTWHVLDRSPEFLEKRTCYEKHQYSKMRRAAALPPATLSLSRLVA